MALTKISTDGVKDDAITKTKIPANQVEASELADNAVDTNALTNAAVTTTKIADSNITTAKIADNAVTMAKLSSGALPTDISVASANIANGQITTAKIADDGVTSAKIADGAVLTTKIADQNVTTAKIQNNAVTTAKIADSAVNTTKIADDAVTIAKLADDAVGTTQIADQAVTLAKLPHGTSSNDGKFLRANNGADPTFETVSAGPTIANQGDNRVITATGTTDALNAESGVTINGDSDLLVGRTTTIDTSERFGIKGPNGDHCTFGITTDGTTNLGIIAFNDNDANFRGQVRYSHSNDKMQFHAAGAERFTIDEHIIKVNDGDIVIGTSGHGINFDTAGSGSDQLLNDYEIGTWTPTPASGTFTIYNQAWYIKIGKLVTCYFYVYNFSDTSSTTHFVIGGLPFAYNNSPKHESFHNICVGGNAANMDSNCIGITGRIGQGGTTEMQFRQERYNSNSLNFEHGHLGSCHLHTTFCYEAA